MMIKCRFALICGATFGLSVAMPGIAAADFIFNATGTSVGGQTIDASADLSLVGTQLKIVLTNNLVNQNGDGNAIGGVSFQVNNPGVLSGNSTLASSAGTLANFNLIHQAHGPDKPDGSYTVVGSEPLSHWQASNEVNLTTLSGAKPNELIWGADNLGGFAGTSVSGGLYTGSGIASGVEHMPFVLGSATFYLDVPGLTSTATISGFTFNFGTSTDHQAGTGGGSFNPTSNTPVPSSIVMLASILVPGVGIFVYRRRKAAAET
jgi:hypothetical protein